MNPAAFAEKIFIHPATKVTTARNTSGITVTQAYLARPDLIKMVVPRQNAITASNWFEIPKIGQRLLAMPSESIAP